MVDAVERGVFFNITFVSIDVVANVCALVVYVFFASTVFDTCVTNSLTMTTIHILDSTKSTCCKA